MAQRNRFSNKRQRARSSNSPPPLRQPLVMEKRVPIEYGKAFIVMEDEQRNTFVYKAGAWIPHSMSIAECRQDCQVKELPQKVNRMTRYEIRCPVDAN